VISGGSLYSNYNATIVTQKTYMSIARNLYLKSTMFLKNINVVLNKKIFSQNFFLYAWVPDTYLGSILLQKVDSSATRSVKGIYAWEVIITKVYFYLFQVTSISVLVTNIDCNRDVWSSH